MNPVPLFLIIVTLPVLIEGDGVKPITLGESLQKSEEMHQEEISTEKSTSKNNSLLDGVNHEELETRKGISFLKSSDKPYTGKCYFLKPKSKKIEVIITRYYKDGMPHGLQTHWYPNGQKSMEFYHKKGIINGLWTEWNPDGQKVFEMNYKDGKAIYNSRKKWKDGELIDRNAIPTRDEVPLFVRLLYACFFIIFLVLIYFVAYKKGWLNKGSSSGSCGSGCGGGGCGGGG